MLGEWDDRFKSKVDKMQADRLLRTARESLDFLTNEIPASPSDVYPYEVNLKEIKAKRVLQREVMQPGWTLAPANPASFQPATKICDEFPPPLGDWWVAIDGKKNGPHDEDGLSGLISQGRMGLATKVWKKGMSGWVTANQVDELFVLFDQPPPFDSEPPPLD
jgi:hypothetical protein